jgi:hypothetical protein
MAKLPLNSNPKSQSIDDRNIREISSEKILKGIGFVGNAFNPVAANDNSINSTYIKENNKTVKILERIENVLMSINNSLAKFIGKEIQEKAIQQDFLEAKLEDFQTETVKKEERLDSIKNFKIDKLEIKDVLIHNLTVENMDIPAFGGIDLNSPLGGPNGQKGPKTPGPAGKGGAGGILKSLMSMLMGGIGLNPGIALNILGEERFGETFNPKNFFKDFKDPMEEWRKSHGQTHTSPMTDETFQQKRVSKDVTQRWEQTKPLLEQAAKDAGIDPKLLTRISFAESGFNPYAKNPGSSAFGLGQFTEDTWNSTVKKYGSKYGLDTSNPSQYRDDPKVQSQMLAEFSKENMQIGERLGGSDPNANIYALHLLGQGGGSSFLKSLRDNPEAKVTSVKGLAPNSISGNKALLGGDITVAQAYQNMSRFMSRGETFAQNIEGTDVDTSSIASYQPPTGQTAPEPTLMSSLEDPLGTLTGLMTEGAIEAANLSRGVVESGAKGAIDLMGKFNKPSDKPIVPLKAQDQSLYRRTVERQLVPETPNKEPEKKESYEAVKDLDVKGIIEEKQKTQEPEKLRPLESFPAPILREKNTNILNRPENTSQLIPPSQREITQGATIDSVSRNINTIKQETALQPQQPIVVNQGGSGGSTRSKNEKTPSNEGVMGMEIGARSNEPTLLKAQYNSVRPV